MGRRDMRPPLPQADSKMEEVKNLRIELLAQVEGAADLDALEEIRVRTNSAISRIEDFEPYVLDTPITLELSLKHYMPVETLAYLPNVEKVNSHTIRFVGEDMVEISRFLRVATGYSIDLQP